MSPAEIEGCLYEQEQINRQMQEGLISAHRDLAKMAGHVSTLVNLMLAQGQRLDAQAQQIETLQAQIKTLQLYHIAPGGSA